MNSINPIQQTALYRQYQANKVYGNAAAPNPSMGTDKADLSEDALSFARVYSTAREMVLEEDTQRSAEKVASLKERIESGAYHVDSESVAARMLFKLPLE